MNTVDAQPPTAVFMDPGVELRSSSTRRDDGGWHEALARFHQAQAALDAAKSEPDQDRYDALLDSQSEALSALLGLPAPDLGGIAAKLDVIVAEQAWELTGAEDCLEILRQDAHRLAATAL